VEGGHGTAQAVADIRARASSGARSRYHRIARAVAVGDAVGGVLAFAGAAVLLGDGVGSVAFAFVASLVVVVWVATFAAFGLYRVAHLAAFEEFRHTIAATTVATTFVAIAAWWWHPESLRATVALAWFLALVTALGHRRLWRWRMRALRHAGLLSLPTLLVGADRDAARLVATLQPRVLGFDVVGYIRSSADDIAPDGLRAVGTLDDLESAIRTSGAQCVFVCSAALSADQVASVLRVARRTDVDVRVTANLPQILSSRLTVSPTGDVPTLALAPARLTRAQARLKRAFDVVLASLVLTVLSPLVAVIAVAVRATSRGPALFWQDRITKDGRIFRMCKFRTMVHESDALLGNRVIDLTKPFFKIEDDPRLTRVGRFLRAYSLDELPQLWNVVRGDLSLVGPRALWSIQVLPHGDTMQARHEVRAGVTGWWQVNGRSEVDPDTALQMDLFYIENWSLGLDLYILLKTVGVVLTRRGAY
jgi:exopolysaccharide biosynthesis polyprenyl glycosylphosphotransferase